MKNFLRKQAYLPIVLYREESLYVLAELLKILLFFILVTACGGAPQNDSSDGESPAILAIAPNSTTDFGNIPSGEETSFTIEIYNSSPTVPARTIQLSGGPLAPFAFSGGAYPGTGGSCNTDLAPLQSCSLVLSATPSALGPILGSLTLSYFNGLSDQLFTFELQANSTEPLPLLEVVSPLASSSHQSTIQLDILCEVSSTINISGSGLVTGVTNSLCSTGTLSLPLLLSPGDGAKELVIDLVMGSGKTNSLTHSLYRDETPPTLSITSPSNNTETQQNIQLQLVCEVGSLINITGSGLLNSISNLTCSSPLSQQITLSAGEGTKTISLTATDSAGNISSVTRDFVRDNTAPILIKTVGDNPARTSSGQYSWSGTCENGYGLTISGDASSSLSCSAGTWTWTSPSYTVSGVHNYNLNQSDEAGNSTQIPLQLIIDKDAPTFSFQQSSPVENNLNNLALNGNCEGSLLIEVSGAATDSFSCGSGVWSWVSPPKTVDGTYDYVFTHTDIVGNQTIQNFQWIRNSVGPQLNITLGEEYQISNQSTVTFGGQCEVGLTVSVTGQESTSFACPAGTWSWTASTQNTDGMKTYQFSQTDIFSNTTNVTGQWYRKTTASSVSSFQSNTGVFSGGKYNTTTGYVNLDLDLASNDALVNILSFCITNSTVAPAANDSCFISLSSPSVGVTPAANVSINGYDHLLGFNEQIYDLYLWSQDSAGNLSNLSAGGSGTLHVDTLKFDYFQGAAPSLIDVVSSNTDLPNFPPTVAQTQVPTGTDVFVIWKASDDNPLPAGSITLSYSEDSTNFTTFATSIDPHANTGCPNITLQTNQGCYRWANGSPTNSSYKIVVQVSDNFGLSSQQETNELNITNLRIIAGNTELGTNTSAKSAMFNTHIRTSVSNNSQLVVLNDGRLVFNDISRGLLIVDPVDGIQKILAPRTGVISGDGGPAITATVGNVHRLALDYSNRLWIYDINRIRRINLNSNPPTIDHVIGGGVSQADTETPANVQLYNLGNNNGTIHDDARRMIFFPAPNGDFYFQSDRSYKSYTLSTYRYRKYNAASGMVESYSVNPGTLANVRPPFMVSSRNIMNCEFWHSGFELNIGNSSISSIDLTIRAGGHMPSCPRDDSATTAYGRVSIDLASGTGSLSTGSALNSYLSWVYLSYTGMDGNLYQLINNSYIVRKNPDNTYTRVIGSTSSGACVDGTAATSCKMNVRSLFVSDTGKIYVWDDGLIRTIEAGVIRTLYGQRSNYGDGINALNARFAALDYIGRSNNGRIVASDSYLIKEFVRNGNIDIQVGNGSYQAGAPFAVDPKTVGVYSNDYVTVDPQNGDIYYRGSSERIYRLNKSSGISERVVGCGSNNYFTSDGLLGNSIACNNQNYVLPKAVNNGRLLTGHYRYESSVLRNQDYMYKFYDSNNSFVQSHFSGVLAPYTSEYQICSSGDLTANCLIPASYRANAPRYEAISDRWYFFRARDSNTYNKQLYSMQENGTLLFELNVPHNVSGGHDVYTRSGERYVAYCASNGNLYEHNIDTDTNNQLSWQDSSLSCRGRSLFFDPSSGINGAIVFPFSKDGLTGVAEYFL